MANRKQRRKGGQKRREVQKALPAQKIMDEPFIQMRIPPACHVGWLELRAF